MRILDMAGKALIAYMAPGAKARQYKGGPLYRMYQRDLEIAERNDPELARKMRAARDAQQELDEHIISYLLPERSR